MADKKYTQLTAATPDLADTIIFVDASEPAGTENRKCTFMTSLDNFTHINIILPAIIFCIIRCVFAHLTPK